MYLITENASACKFTQCVQSVPELWTSLFIFVSHKKFKVLKSYECQLEINVAIWFTHVCVRFVSYIQTSLEKIYFPYWSWF